MSSRHIELSGVCSLFFLGHTGSDNFRIIGDAELFANFEPMMTIEQIAYECGFADHSHFTHSFRRLFGMSPTSYARQLSAS